jgi:hypothetical protein
MVKEEVIMATKWGIMVEVENLQVLVDDIAIGSI